MLFELFSVNCLGPKLTMNGQGGECWTLYYTQIMYDVMLLSRESKLTMLS